MTNRDRLRRILRRIVSEKPTDPFSLEIDYRLNDIEREEPGFDIVDAFEELEDLASSEPTWREFRRACREVMIEAGYYRIMPPEEIARWRADNRGNPMRPRTPWSFTYKRDKYTSDESWATWIKEGDK